MRKSRALELLQEVLGREEGPRYVAGDGGVKRLLRIYRGASDPRASMLRALESLGFTGARAPPADALDWQLCWLLAASAMTDAQHEEFAGGDAEEEEEEEETDVDDSSDDEKAELRRRVERLERALRAKNGRPAGGRNAGSPAGWQWNALDVTAWPEVPPEARLGVFQELRARYGALDTTSHRHEYRHLLDVTQTVLQTVGCVEDPAGADAALGAVARQVVRRLEVLLRGQQSWEEAAAMAAKWRTQSAPDDLRDGFEAADAVRNRRAERAAAAKPTEPAASRGRKRQ